MLVLNIIAIPWDVTPNLILSLVALIGAFVTLYKFYQNYNKTKLDIAKQTAFNLEKVESIEKFGQEMAKKLENIENLLRILENKQEVDYEYINKVIDNFERDFNYYRDFIIKQLKDS